MRGNVTTLMAIVLVVALAPQAVADTISYEFSGTSFTHVRIGDATLPPELAGLSSFEAQLSMQDDLSEASLRVKYNTGYTANFSLSGGRIYQSQFPDPYYPPRLAGVATWGITVMRPDSSTTQTVPPAIAANVVLRDSPAGGQYLTGDLAQLSANLPDASRIDYQKWIEVIFSGGYYLRGNISSILPTQLPHDPPPSAPPKEVDLSVPEKGDATKLVVITHGWTRGGGQETVQSTRAWMNAMAGAIESSGQLGDGWAVDTLDWTAQSSTGVLADAAFDHDASTRALMNAFEIGNAYGDYLYSAGYKEVHLIAHSAGSGLVQGAIDQIRLLEATAGMPAEERMIIHATFLDGYQGLNGSLFAAERYGRNSNWADNYWVTDITGGSTEGPYKYAYNRDLSGWYAWDDHGDPIDFYSDTALGTLAAGPGWQLSREAGASWATDLAGRPIGPVGPYGVRNGYEGNPDVIPIYPQQLSEGGVLARSGTGTVSFEGDTLLERTGSPVWVVLSVQALGPVDFVTFTAEFTSAADARGVLAVSWNGELIGSLDEFYGRGADTWTFGLGDLFEAGSYELAFRLDPYSNIDSEIAIWDVYLGNSGLRASAVPLPSGVVPGAVLLFCLALVRFCARGFRVLPRSL